jgi:DNA-binding CsgD family transcriptional regulator
VPTVLDRALGLEAKALDRGEPPQPIPLLWLHCTDDVDGARARFAMEEQWYRDRGEETWVADRASHLALAELHAGAVERAERLAEESCAALGALDAHGPRAMVFEKRSLVDAHRGREARARATMRELVAHYDGNDQPWWAALSLSTLAFAEYAAGDHRAADRALVEMHERAGRIGARDVLFDRSEPFHVEVLLELGETSRAEESLGRLEQRGQRLPRPWISAALPRTRALLAAERGDLDAAFAHLAAVDEELMARLPFEHGWTLLSRGRIERRAKRKRAATESLGGAADLFRRLGAPAFAARADAERSRVGLRRATTGLSETELLVARLAAGGMTNREVARAAFISQKTVEANLARVYRKLGIRSRAELGSWLVQEGVGRPGT